MTVPPRIAATTVFLAILFGPIVAFLYLVISCAASSKVA